MTFPENFPLKPHSKISDNRISPNLYANGDISLDILGKSFSHLNNCMACLHQFNNFSPTLTLTCTAQRSSQTVCEGKDDKK
jgi:ubiquitin-protein ligase